MKKCPIKYPSKIGTIIGMMVAIVHAIFMLRLMGSPSGFAGILIYAGLAVGLLLAVVQLILATMYTMSRKATDIQLDQKKLVIHEHTIQASEMKRIMIRGFFKPVIGILPHGYRVVPTYMTFRFTMDEDKGMSDLKDWAERNGIKMGSKWFRNWI